MSQDHFTSPPATLQDFISRVTTGEAELMPTDETWEQMIERINVAGRIHRITDEVFEYFLEVLPPRWMRGSYFAFAEGQDPLQLFWARGHGKEESPDYFTRQLIDDEIDRFCRLTGLPRNYGSY